MPPKGKQSAKAKATAKAQAKQEARRLARRNTDEQVERAKSDLWPELDEEDFLRNPVNGVTGFQYVAKLIRQNRERGGRMPRHAIVAVKQIYTRNQEAQPVLEVKVQGSNRACVVNAITQASLQCFNQRKRDPLYSLIKSPEGWSQCEIVGLIRHILSHNIITSKSNAEHYVQVLAAIAQVEDSALWHYVSPTTRSNVKLGTNFFRKISKGLIDGTDKCEPTELQKRIWERTVYFASVKQANKPIVGKPALKELLKMADAKKEKITSEDLDLDLLIRLRGHLDVPDRAKLDEIRKLVKEEFHGTVVVDGPTPAKRAKKTSSAPSASTKPSDYNMTLESVKNFFQ